MQLNATIVAAIAIKTTIGNNFFRFPLRPMPIIAPKLQSKKIRPADKHVLWSFVAPKMIKATDMSIPMIWYCIAAVDFEVVGGVEDLFAKLRINIKEESVQSGIERMSQSLEMGLYPFLCRILGCFCCRFRGKSQSSGVSPEERSDQVFRLSA